MLDVDEVDERLPSACARRAAGSPSSGAGPAPVHFRRLSGDDRRDVRGDAIGERVLIGRASHRT